MKPALVPAALTVVAVLWGIGLRFDRLGSSTFETDEAIQYQATRGVMEQDEPILPSGLRYGRGEAYSRLAAGVLSRIDSAELAMRLPAATFGSLALILLTAIAWALGGPWVAFWAAVLMAIYPEGVRLSRFGRFYTLQLVPGLLALYTGWRAFAPDREGTRRPDTTGVQWLWAGATIILFAMAARVQIVTLSVAGMWGLLMAGRGILDWRRSGTAAWKESAALQLTAVGVVVAIVILLFRFDLVIMLYERAVSVPMWARLGRTGNPTVTYYYRALSPGLPLAVALLPVTGLALWLRRPKLATYLLVWFGGTLAVHTFLLPWKQERYVLLAVPAFLLISAFGAAGGAGALYRYLHDTFASRTRMGGGIALWATALAALFAIVSQPAFNMTRRMGENPDQDGWRATAAILDTLTGAQSLPLGSASPAPALHYWGRLAFAVQPALLETWGADTSPGLSRNPVGSPDIYAGVPVLPGPGGIRKRFRERGGVIIGIEEKYVRWHNIDTSLVSRLERDARELCQGECGTMRLYEWRW